MGERQTTSIRVDSEAKAEATKVFKSLGLDFSSGVEIYLRTVAREQRIPFALDLAKRPQDTEASDR